jgi:hypothetical protein
LAISATLRHLRACSWKKAAFSGSLQPCELCQRKVHEGLTRAAQGDWMKPKAKPFKAPPSQFRGAVLAQT